MKIKYLFLLFALFALSACSSYTYKPADRKEANLPPGITVKKKVSVQARSAPPVKITKKQARELFTNPEKSPLLKDGVDNTLSFPSTLSARVTAVEEMLVLMGYKSLVITGFASMTADIPGSGMKEIKGVDWKKQKILRISGHASYGGDSKKNLEYSLARAKNVSEMLIKKGADISDLTLYGLGETNRFGSTRIENQAIVVIYKEK